MPVPRPSEANDDSDAAHQDQCLVPVCRGDSDVELMETWLLLLESCVTVYLLGVIIHGDLGSNLVAWW